MTHHKMPIVVAISFNEEIKGAASQSVRELVMKSGAEKRDIDYYKIVPSLDNLHDIYTDKEKMKAVFAFAKENAKMWLENADCLILPGNGAIVDPRLFEETLSEADKPRIDLRRAIAEMALAHVAMEKGMPILAICGGHQILNVFLGGKVKDVDEESLDKYLEYAINEFDSKSELGQITFRKKSKREAAFFGAHAQIVDAEHIGGKKMVMEDDLLAIVANSKNDASIEAMEAKYGAPIYSLQFHPEVAIVGMYSVVKKAIAYHAPTKEEFQVSFNIIAAFKQAGEAYALKKQVMLEIKQKVTRVEASKGVLGDDKAPKVTKEKEKDTLRSIFKDTKLTTPKSDSDLDDRESDNKPKKPR